MVMDHITDNKQQIFPFMVKLCDTIKNLDCIMTFIPSNGSKNL